MDEVDCVHIFYVLKICKIFRNNVFFYWSHLYRFLQISAQVTRLVSSAREKWEMWGNEQFVLHSNVIHDLVIYW